MNLLEILIGTIAPHNCVVCELEGTLLCSACLNSELPDTPGRCYRCHKASPNQAVCKDCRRSVDLRHVWISTSYEEIPKRLIHKFKFERAIVAAEPIAEKIDQTLPGLPQDVTVCHIPTVRDRVRMRGYDQAEEIAKVLAKDRGYRRKNLLVRTGKSRQVGSGRRDRFKQLEKAFKVADPVAARGAYILLVDDITTTGATTESAAKILKKSGAKIIDAAVFAQA